MRTAHEFLWLMREVEKAEGIIIICVAAGEVDRMHDLVAAMQNTRFAECRIASIGCSNVGYYFDQIFCDETFDVLNEDVYHWYNSEVVPRGRPGHRVRYHTE